MKKKIYTRLVSVTLPEEMFEQIKNITKRENISLSDYIRAAILKEVNLDRKENIHWQDIRCDCCGKHVSELKPFDKGSAREGSFLIDTIRPVTLDPEYQEDYGFDGSLECRDCIKLSDHDYFYKRWPEIINRPDPWAEYDSEKYKEFYDALETDKPTKTLISIR